ncbi:hypothetical protein Tco_0306571, partial [Tanacetum coccineum]
ATSVHDDVSVPDAAADDNAKATSVCDDIDEADAATDDNAKATSVHDDFILLKRYKKMKRLTRVNTVRNNEFPTIYERLPCL